MQSPELRGSPGTGFQSIRLGFSEPTVQSTPPKKGTFELIGALAEFISENSRFSG